MKVTSFIEYKENKVSLKGLSDNVKNIWKDKGLLVKDVDTIELYVKPEDNMCYYVVNETEQGSFSL